METSSQESSRASVNRRYSEQFVANIINLVKVDRMSVAEISRQSSVRPNMIYRWLRRHELQEARKDPSSIPANEQELEQLRRERICVSSGRWTF